MSPATRGPAQNTTDAPHEYFEQTDNAKGTGFAPLVIRNYLPTTTIENDPGTTCPRPPPRPPGAGAPGAGAGGGAVSLAIVITRLVLLSNVDVRAPVMV